MPKSSVQLSNRAPETQQVLRKIKGWGINWGVTIVLALFLAVLWGSFQLKFPKTEAIQVQIESPSLVKVVTASSGFNAEAGTLELNGANYTLTSKEGSTYFQSANPIVVQSTAPVSAQFTHDVNVLAIIFQGLF